MQSAQHDLALCYNVSKLNIVELNYKDIANCYGIRKGDFFIGNSVPYAFLLCTFVDGFTLSIIELLKQHGILIDGDFYLDQMLLENVGKVAPLIQTLNLSQR